MLRLSDDQWERIREHFPEENIPEGRPGRKPIPTREVLEAALWILNTGAQWHMLPQCYPNYKPVHRRFQQWCEREVLREVLTQLANTLREQGDIDEAALEAAVRYLATELGPRGMRVNAVSPGPMKTRASSGIRDFDKLFADAPRRAPLTREVDIDDVGSLCAFLVSDAARAITGDIHYVDGGFHVLA